MKFVIHFVLDEGIRY